MDSVKKPKLVALGALGIVVPVALAFTAYMVSRTTIGSAGTVPSLTHTPAQIEVSKTQSSDSSPSTAPTTGRQQGSGSGSVTPQPGATDDHGGKCSEPEHANDPSCDGSGDDNSNSGPGGGGGDDSSNSGHGSGGDD
jgi:hypothetical protein